jgi:hypothetical protein
MTRAGAVLIALGMGAALAWAIVGLALELQP